MAIVPGCKRENANHKLHNSTTTAQQYNKNTEKTLKRWKDEDEISSAVLTKMILVAAFLLFLFQTCYSGEFSSSNKITNNCAVQKLPLDFFFFLAWLNTSFLHFDCVFLVFFLFFFFFEIAILYRCHYLLFIIIIFLFYLIPTGLSSCELDVSFTVASFNMRGLTNAKWNDEGVRTYFLSQNPFWRYLGGTLLY